HHSRRIAGFEGRLSLDEPRVETMCYRHSRRLAPQAVDLNHERVAILGLHGVLVVASDPVVGRYATVRRRQEWDRVFDEDVPRVRLDAIAHRVTVRAGRLRPEDIVAASQRGRDVVPE